MPAEARTVFTAALAELAVFAAAAVVAGVAGLTNVKFLLARDASSHPRNRSPARFGDRLAAILAVLEAFAPWQAAPSTRNLVFYTCVDLILHGPIAGPSNSHGPRELARRGWLSNLTPGGSQ